MDARTVRRPLHARGEGLPSALGLGFERGPLQSELAILYTLVGKLVEAVAAFEAAEYLAAASVHVARAYVALGRCADVERVSTKVERGLGVEGPARELRVILSACPVRPAR